MTEIYYIGLLCTLLGGGDEEARRTFEMISEGKDRWIRVDCETHTHVIEVGMDGDSSLRDSVHQATFASILTGKRPMVVIIDRDGILGRYEREIADVAEVLQIAYARCAAGFLESWSATTGSGRARTRAGHDLPLDPTLSGRCPRGAGDGGGGGGGPSPRMRSSGSAAGIAGTTGEHRLPFRQSPPYLAAHDRAYRTRRDGIAVRPRDGAAAHPLSRWVEPRADAGGAGARRTGADAGGRGHRQDPRADGADRASAGAGKGPPERGAGRHLHQQGRARDAEPPGPHDG